MKKFKLLIALFALAIFPVQAEQNSTKGLWEFGPYIGMFFPDNYGSANLDKSLLVGGRLGYFITSEFSVEGSFHRAFSETSGGSETNIDASRLNLLWNFLPGKFVRPFLTVGGGWERTSFPFGTDNDYGLNGGGGLRFFVNPHFNIRLEGRYNTVDIGRAAAGRQHNYEGMLGFSWLFGKATESVSVDEPKDADQDGVSDGDDRCPNTPAGAVVDATGCVVQVKEEIKPADADLDGIEDDTDKCPNTEMGVPVDASGCPRDSDGDNVSDDKDRCPNTKPGTEIDASGCPLVTKSRGVLKGVTFGSGSTALTSNAQRVLDGVAADLKEFPDVKIEIQGHTDNTGSSARNTTLSQERAESVMSYLINKGVDASRMTAKGYGPAVPIADNKTREGRESNRRVEIKWLD
ncbi:MAG: OmpA family protein [Bdellovibrionales bacterium]|nr:OmpA family protein [Bdellovibrionales bacterium]